MHKHSTKVRSHSYSLIYSFLCRYFVCYIQGSTSLIFFRSVSGSSAFIFRIQYIHSSTTLMFPTLYSWKCCSYILYAISMAIWSGVLSGFSNTWWWNAWSPKARVTVKFLEERECKYEPASCDKIAKHHAGQDENSRKLSEGKRQFENQKKDNMLCSVSSLT